MFVDAGASNDISTVMVLYLTLHRDELPIINYLAHGSVFIKMWT